MLALAASPALAKAPDPDPVPAKAADAIQPERLAEARRTVDLAFPPDEREAMFVAAQSSVVEQEREVFLAKLKNDPGALAIVNRHVDAQLAEIRKLTLAHIPTMMEAIAHAYAREFSVEELRAISAFAASPAGHRYITRSTALLADPDVAEANKQLFRAAQPIIEQSSKSLLVELTAWFAKHPPKPSTGS